jgi:tetratricopeptide (TPR) repeat protein
MLAVFRAAEAAWPTQGTDDWLAAYAPEMENFRASVDWAFGHGASELGVPLVAQSGALAEEMSLQPDLLRWTRLAMAQVTEATPPADAARVLYLHTMHQKRLGPTDVPAERMRAIALFRATGDRVWLSRALRQTAIARAMPGQDNAEVLAMLAEAISLVRDLAPHKDLATAYAHTGGAHFLNADQDQSRAFNEQALSMRQALHDGSGVLASAVNLAELLFLDGDTAGALAFATQAEAEARRRNAQGTLALILCNLAGYRLQGGDSAGGMVSACEALALSRAVGQDYLAVMCLEHAALALGLRGDADEAARLLGYTDAFYVRTGQTRERLEQAGYDRLCKILAQELSGVRAAALRAEGGRWTSDEAMMSLSPRKKESASF